MSKIISFLKKLNLWPKPKPSGVCEYCGGICSSENPFYKGLFAHAYCREKAWEQRKQEEQDRKQIDLIKIAMRELKNE